MTTASLLRETLWSMVSEIHSGLAFDYRAYTLENLARVPHPKLLIFDSASAWVSTLRVLEGLLPNCRTVIMPPSELRHFAPLDAPEFIVELLEEFLAFDESDSKPHTGATHASVDS